MTALTKTKFRRRAIGFSRSYGGILLFSVAVTASAVSQLALASVSYPVAQQVPTHSAGSSAILKVLPTVTPTPLPLTDEQMIKALPNGLLVWKTYGHESTYGKNDYCKENGLGFNGFGYGESDDKTYACFASLAEVASKVSVWFTTELQTKTEDQALCYYNTGKVLDSCGYAEYSKAL